LPDTRRPAIKQTEFERDDRQLRHANEIQNSDQEKVAGDFLADFLAQERTLQVG
jgi:hypothetical protein